MRRPGSNVHTLRYDGDEPPFVFVIRVIAEHGFSTTAYFKTNTWRRRQHWLPDVIRRTMRALSHARDLESRVTTSGRSRYELSIDLHGTMVVVIVDEREASIHNIHFKDCL